jgi:hypothetical protein
MSNAAAESVRSFRNPKPVNWIQLQALIKLDCILFTLGPD